MQLTDDDISDFIAAWRADFGETLTAEVARTEALRLLDFFAWMVEEMESQEKEPDDSEPVTQSIT